MGRSHALSGVVAGAAATLFLHASPARLAVAVAVTAGAAVLPDIDHPDASAARSFGFVTRAFAWLIEHISGGHRHGTHSLAGIAAFTAATAAADAFRRTLPGEVVLGLLVVLVIASALRALKIGGHGADLLAVAATAALLWRGFDLAALPWMIALGTATHIAGDMLTDEGVPLFWPLSRKHLRLLPEPLAFTTGTRPERWVVTPLLAAALVLVLAVYAGGLHLPGGGTVPHL